MKAQDALKQIAILELKRQLSQGRITAQELERRLSRAIEDEMQKGPQRMDSAFITACEDLLFELNAPASKQLPQQSRDNWYHLRERLSRRRPQPLLWPRLRRAAVALSLVLLVGGGLWMVRQRPAPERKHLSAEGSPMPSPDAFISLPPVTFQPMVTPTATPLPTPTPTPTEPAVTEQPSTPTPEPLPAGRDKYHRLSELKRTAPKRWEATYELDGRTVQVNVPILWPEADRLPLYELKWMPILNDDLRERVLAAYPRVHTMRNEVSSQLDLIVAEGSRSYFEGPESGYGASTRAVDQPAQNNSYGKDEPLPFLKGLLERLNIQVGDIRKDVQLASSGLYRVVPRSQVGSPDEPYINYLNFDAPVPGFETGSYSLSAAQTLGGLPLFPGLNNRNSRPAETPLDPYIFLRILNEKEFRLRANFAQVTGQREADLPILSPELVIRSIERQIKEGTIRRVDSLELGYMLYQAQYLRPGEGEQDAQLLAVPVWRVRGIKLSSTDTELNSVHTRMYLDGLADSYQDPMFDIRFNAQTGEYLDPDRGFPSRINPAILTFQQLDSEEEDLQLF